MYGVLICNGCGTREHYDDHKLKPDQWFRRTIADMGGGWGRARLIGKCIRCDYPHAVLFHAHSLDDESDEIMIDYYMTTRLPMILGGLEDADR